MRRVHSILLLAVAYAVLAGIGFAVFSVVAIRADMTVLLPERQDGELALLFRSLRDSPANRTVMIALAPEDEKTARAPRALSRAFRLALEETGLFGLVANGEVDNSIAALRPFIDHRYRLNPPLDPDSFSATGLRDALEDLLKALRGFGGSVVQDIMGEDPTLRTLKVTSLWRQPVATTRQGIWVSQDGNRLLLLAQTKEAGFDLAAQAGAISAIREATTRLEGKFGPLELSMSGPSVIAVESRDLAERESERLIILSVPLVAIVLFLFLRRIAALPLLFLPLASGFLAGTCVVALFFGDIHVTTLGFGVTLLGIAVDYPLHLMARIGPRLSPVLAARRIGAALFVAVTTTMIAFLPLSVSSFPGLAQLGVFTVTGLAVAAAVTRGVLPYILADRAVVRGDVESGWLGHVHAGMHAGRYLALAAGVAAVALVGFRGEPVWQQDLAALSPIPEALRSQDQALRRDLNVVDPRVLLTVDAATAEQALERSAALIEPLRRFQQSGKLLSFDLAARYLPTKADQASWLGALPSSSDLRANLQTALEGLPFRAATFEAFPVAVAAAREAGPIGLEDLSGTPLYTRLAPMMLRAEDGAKALIFLRGLQNPGELRAIVEESGIEGVRYVDLKAAAQSLMDRYRTETLRWVAFGALLALGLLAVVLRSARAVGAVAVPVLLSVAITTAILVVMNTGLSIFHLLGLMMVAGLGVDYAVFLRREDAMADDASEDGERVRAVLLCAATSFSVFALLATAAVPVLSQIGTTVAIGSAFS
ncbi:MAG: MMPL family transporter, partial [Pseudomonadota bacterium]